MILLAEKDAALRKKLCDMLNRERIIGVASKQQVLEALAQHQKKLNAIIADASLLSSILSNDTIVNLCMKLAIPIPPIVVLYRPEQETIIKMIGNGKYHFEFVEFDERDENFPDQYIRAILRVYPEISIDMSKAHQVWKGDIEGRNAVDVREWLNESGFTETGGKKEPAGATEKPVTKAVPAATEYKKLYFELRKKYDQLMADFEDMKKILE